VSGPDGEGMSNRDVDRDGDVNGDGRTDIVGANHSGSCQPVELWLNRPDPANELP